MCDCYKRDHQDIDSKITTITHLLLFLSEEATRLDEWEIPREKLHTFRAIGEGAFGVVMEGIWDSGTELLLVVIAVSLKLQTVLEIN